MRSLYVNSYEETISLIRDIIREESEGKSRLRIGIPGGRGAKKVIEALFSLADDILRKVELYLVDERLEGEKNEPMLMDYGIDEALKQSRFTLSQLIIPSEMMVLPREFSFDLLFLGVGEDGHFASLFPSSYRKSSEGEPDLIAIHESPKPPDRRVTFSYHAFQTYTKEGKVFLLCFGEGKRDAFARYMRGEETPETLPSLFFHARGFNPLLITDLAEKGDSSS